MHRYKNALLIVSILAIFFVLANIKVDGKSSDRVVEAPKSIISAIDISELLRWHTKGSP